MQLLDGVTFDFFGAGFLDTILLPYLHYVKIEIISEILPKKVPIVLEIGYLEYINFNQDAIDFSAGTTTITASGGFTGIIVNADISKAETSIETSI